MTAHHDAGEDHDLGLAHDLPRLLSRRRALAVMGGAGLTAALAGCGLSDPDGGGSSATAAGGTAARGPIPEETAGPFPADGSNGVDALSMSGVVRRDIRGSLPPGTAVAAGVPLTLRLRVVDAGRDVAPRAGAAVYVWHCDAEGRYSLYSDGVTGESYLRGVQAAGEDGWVTFTSVYPGAYPGRWPHVHFEVYGSAADATAARGRLRTSQLALPEDTSRLVYAADGYASSLGVLDGTSLASDLAFSDGYSLQLATVTGTVGEGLTATLAVPV